MTSPGTARTAELFARPYRSLTIGLVLTITLAAFEALATGTIMPLVAGDLGGIELYGWTFSAFFLGNLVAIVVVGGLLDRGRLGPPFAGCLLLFSIGLALAGAAPSMEVLVVARLLQGLGAGGIGPVAYVAIGRVLPEHLRPRMFAILSTAWVAPAIVGPAIAGIAAEAIHWRVVFLGLLPLLAASGTLALVALRTVPPGVGTGRGLRERLMTAARIAGGTGLILALLGDPESISRLVGVPAGPVAAGLAIGGVLVGLGLVVPAFRAVAPPGTLRIARGLPAAILLRGTLTLAFFTADAYVPLLLQGVRGTSAPFAGLALTAGTLAWTAGAWIQARRIDRLGAPRFIALGFACVGVGIAASAAVLLPAVPVVGSIAAWSIAGLGMGFAYSAFTVVVLRDAPPDAQGTAAASLQLSDSIGTAIGTGIAGAIIAAGERAARLDLGLAGAFALGVLIALTGLALAGRVARIEAPGGDAFGSPGVALR